MANFSALFLQGFRPPKKFTPNIHVQNGRHSSPISLSGTHNLFTAIFCLRGRPKFAKQRIFTAICALAAEIHCNVGHDAGFIASAMPRCGELDCCTTRCGLLQFMECFRGGSTEGVAILLNFCRFSEPVSEGFKWEVGSVGRWMCKFGAPHFCLKFSPNPLKKVFSQIGGKNGRPKFADPRPHGSDPPTSSPLIFHAAE